MPRFNFESFLTRMKLKAKKRNREHPYAKDGEEFHIFEKDESTNPFLYDDAHLSIARIKTYGKLKILKKVRNPFKL